MKDKTLNEFTNHMFLAKEPLVGGGSTGALCGSLAASLVGLISSISFDGLDEKQKSELTKMADKCKEVRKKLLTDVDKDANSFSSVMQAFKMPKVTDEEKKARSVEIQRGYKHAISVPLEVAKTSAELFEIVEFLFVHGNKNAETDTLAAAMCARTSVLAAVYNVKINLKSVKDEEYVAETFKAATELEKFAVQRENEILSLSDLKNK